MDTNRTRASCDILCQDFRNWLIELFAWGVILKVAQQKENKKDDEDETKSTAAASRTAIGIAATAAKKDKENNYED